MARRSSSRRKDNVNKEEKGKQGVTGAKSGGNPFASTLTEQLVKDVASFSFATPVGSRVLLAPGSANNNAAINLRSFPGIMGIRWNPAVGYSNNSVSPVNAAARALMTRVRMATTGSRNYDESSLMLYLLGVDSAYLYLAHLKRIYGCLRLFNPENRFLPQGLVTACDGAYSDLVANMANFRAYINTYAMRLAALPIPKVPLIDRHQAMSAAVYADNDSAKAQLYVFVPDAVYKYDYDTDDNLGKLSLEPLSSINTDGTIDSLSLSDYIADGESILAPLLTTYGQEDFAVMGGDILRAYGEDGVYRAAGIAEDYFVEIVFDELMLHRILNLSCFGSLTADGNTPADYFSTFDVVQNVDNAPALTFLESLPTLDLGEDNFYSADLPQMNKILNSNRGPMGPDVALEALSFAHIPQLRTAGATVNSFDLTNIGTEVVSSMLIYYYSATSFGGPWTIKRTNPFTTIATVAAKPAVTNAFTATEVAGPLNALIAFFGLFSAFDYAPILFPGHVIQDQTGEDVGGTTLNTTYPFGDINDYAVVTAADIERIRNIKLLADLGL